VGVRCHSADNLRETAGMIVMHHDDSDLHEKPCPTGLCTTLRSKHRRRVQDVATHARSRDEPSLSLKGIATGVGAAPHTA